MQPRLKVLCISGSPRGGGNTDVLLGSFLRGVEETGVEGERIFLRDYVIQPCIGCERCRKDRLCSKLHDGMQLLYPKIIESTGLILGSPTHSYNVTAMVKAFIDRLYPFFEFSDDRPRKYHSRLAGQGRKAIVYSVSEQDETGETGFTLEAMGYPLTALGYEVVDDISVTGFFDRGAVRHHMDLLDKVYEKGRWLAEMILST
ncbi:MAG: flavodoxin family protein [Deltaproteobacteria bacterium]|nr:flavodoxin family protein [Deltaproteobacteria bacterium]MBW2151976.1 flavodoxin family protein [Deltaproteobacteria bacterium]